MTRSIFIDPITGKLDRLFLRHCAVRRLVERGHIDRERAASLLKCAPGLRQRVVDSWFEVPA